MSSPSSFHYSFYDYYNSHANNNALIYFLKLVLEYISQFHFGTGYLIVAKSTANKMAKAAFKFQLTNFLVYKFTFSL